MPMIGEGKSGLRDYYKTITVAFRKAAKTAHLDKGGSEAKMARVNEAYEVLRNPGECAVGFLPFFSFFFARLKLKSEIGFSLFFIR
jgi:hypothetical protein